MLKLNIQLFAEDGKVIIGTEIDSKGIDKGIASIEAKMEKLRQKAEEPYYKNGVKFASGNWNLTDEEDQYYDRLQATLNRLEIEKAKMVTADQQIANVINEQANNSQKTENIYNKWVDDTMQLSNGLRIVKKNTEEISKDSKKIDFSEVNSQLTKVGNSLTGVINKVARWGLAVFGIRSAYMFVRQAMSTLSQYDDQMTTNIEWIRYLLASSLKPIIETIINLAYKLLVYIGYISKAWFGVNIFANASKKEFAGVNKNIKNSTKNAKELQKTIAGFDEMNILQKNGSTAQAGGGGGVSSKLPDFPDMDKIPIPKWIEQIGKFKDLWKNTLDFWENDWEKFFKDNDSDWGLFVEGIGDKLHAFYNILKGFGEILIGVFKIIVGALTGNFNKIGEGFDILWQGAKDVFDGWVQWFQGTWKLVLGFVKGILRTLFGGLSDIIITPVKSSITTITSIFNNWYNGVKKILDGIIKLFKGDFKNGISNIANGIKSILLAPINSIISGINVLIKGLNKIKVEAPSWVPGIGGKKWGISIPTIPKLAKGGIINQPGKGVPLAYGGETGTEAVVPLTDSQQMQLLGEAIGKYITINANITNTMNGRVISRELQKVQNESDFAFNR